MTRPRFDFDKPVDRNNTLSAKWNYIKESVGVEDALPMWVADMDFETVPEVKAAILDRAQHGIYGYTARSEGYYDAIIDWNLKRHGWQVDKKWITHSPGVVNALFTAVRAFTKPGDGILIQPPVYPPFFRAISMNDCKTILNPLKLEGGRYVPDLADFADKVGSGRVKLFILCNPHNPVGRVFTEDELRVMGELCLKHGVVVISDEIHSDLLFKPHRHVPFASISEAFAQNTVVCTAPSKTFNLAGLSTSNIIIPNDELRRRYDAANEQVAQKSHNIFGAAACEAAYRHGEEWLDQLMSYIDGNRQYAVEFIEARLPQLKVYNPEGTYFLWLDCRSLGLGNQELEHFLLHEAKLWFNQGYTFGKEGDGFVRINIGCQRSTVEEALKRLEYAVHSPVRQG
ncbi:pyridoxal phosphate-dependent aminotransferase [Paenibacillus sp. 7124]|uniref:cysteine-S-conjugate beta-lyase n=1 Tax=Paenibacillus apii TaxID=1850370 RepID=A0A6M1PMQ1_9BACL|nr:MalY/PatB family protein [Paenibacillus apii]NGM84476.1 pyridoxal phosphate-dependent aminotransferase [Paenibacillus apii]